MKGYRRYLKIGAVVVVLSVMTAGAIGLTALRSQTGKKALVSAIEKSARNYFSKKDGQRISPRLRIGKISNPGLTGLILEKVLMTDEKSHEELIYAPKVRITYNLIKAAIYKGHPESALTGVEFYDPKLALTRDDKGSWTLLSLLAPGTKSTGGLLEKANFAVNVRGGEVRLTGVGGLTDVSIPFNVKLHLRKGHLDISSFDGSMGYGKLKVDGTIDLSRSLMDIKAEGTGIKAGHIAALSGHPMKYNIDGDTSGVLHLSGSFSHPKIDYIIKVAGGSIASGGHNPSGSGNPWTVPVDNLTIKGSYGSKAVRISGAEARTGGTVITGRGILNMPGSLDFAWSARSANLEKDMPSVADMIGWEKGRAEFRGTLGGSLDAPVLSASVKAGDIRVFDIPADSLSGSLSVSDGKLAINNGKALIYGEPVSVEGILGISAPGPTSLWLSAKNASAEAIYKTLGIKPIGYGKADMKAKVSGTAGGYGISGILKAARYSAFGFDTSDIAIGFDYDNNGLRLRNGRLTVGEGSATLGGSMDPDGNLNIDVHGEGLQLASLGTLVAKSADMSGVTRIDAAIRGNTRNPRITGNVQADSLAYGRFDADTAAGRFAYYNGELSLPAFSLYRGDAIYTGSGSVSGITGGDSKVNSGKTAIEGQIDVSGESLAELVDIAGGKPLAGLAQGVVDGTIRLGGTVDSPVAAIEASLPAIDLAGSRLSTALELLYNDGKLKISRLKMPKLEQAG